MTDSEILRELIKPAGIISTEISGGKHKLILEEANICKCEILNVPEDVYAVKVDMFKSPDSIFLGGRGECRRADFALISESRKRIILIELKNGTDSRNEVVQQLIGADCFITYLQDIGRKFWEEKEFLKKYTYRFVCICRVGSIGKRKTAIESTSAKHDKPNSFLKISSPHHIQFNQLAS